MTYDHSIHLVTYLDLGVMAYSIGATIEGEDILAQRIPWRLPPLVGW
jgi:hypothetical protein